MIDRYISDDALNAQQDILLVPVAADSNEVREGFARRVFDAFPIAEVTFIDEGGIAEGDILTIGYASGNSMWTPPYSLAICAIHRHTSEGWINTPSLLTTSLDALTRLPHRSGNLSVATAGIPGTGFSGLRGNADPEAIKEALEKHQLHITVYQDDQAGDREPLQAAQPVLPIGKAVVL